MVWSAFRHWNILSVFPEKKHFEKSIYKAFFDSRTWRSRRPTFMSTFSIIHLIFESTKKDNFLWNVIVYGDTYLLLTQFFQINKGYCIIGKLH